VLSRHKKIVKIKTYCETADNLSCLDEHQKQAKGHKLSHALSRAHQIGVMVTPVWSARPLHQFVCVDAHTEYFHHTLEFVKETHDDP